MPTPVLLHKSPSEFLFGSSPDLNHLRIFGCACFPLLRPYNHNKLQPKTSKCVFLGYGICYSRIKATIHLRGGGLGVNTIIIAILKSITLK